MMEKTTPFRRWRGFAAKSLQDIADEMTELSLREWSVEMVHEVEMGERKITLQEAELFAQTLVPPADYLFPEELRVVPQKKKEEDPAMRELSRRAYNCLRNLGVTQLKALEKVTESELRHTKNLGNKTFDEIVSVLEKHELKLRRCEEEKDSNYYVLGNAAFTDDSRFLKIRNWGIREVSRWFMQRKKGSSND